MGMPLIGQNSDKNIFLSIKMCNELEFERRVGLIVWVCVHQKLNPQHLFAFENFGLTIFWEIAHCFVSSLVVVLTLVYLCY